MPPDAALFAYAGMAALALATHQHRRTALPAIGTVPPATARIAGAVLIALSLVAAALSLGIAQGVVTWIGSLCVAAVCLVLLLSRWPRGALLAGLPVAAVALLAFVPRMVAALRI